jgi:hypothetical protein
VTEKHIDPGPTDLNPKFSQVEYSRSAFISKPVERIDLSKKRLENRRRKSSKSGLQTSKRRRRFRHSSYSEGIGGEDEENEVGPWKPSPNLGPGTHDPKDKLSHPFVRVSHLSSKSSTFGNKYAPRFRSEKKTVTPGVGSYNLKTDTIADDMERRKKRHRRSRKTRTRKSHSLYLQPGPGAYEIDRSIDRGLRYGMGTGSRPDLSGKSNGVPGPAYYDMMNLNHKM